MKNIISLPAKIFTFLAFFVLFLFFSTSQSFAQSVPNGSFEATNVSYNQTTHAITFTVSNMSPSTSINITGGGFHIAPATSSNDVVCWTYATINNTITNGGTYTITTDSEQNTECDELPTSGEGYHIGIYDDDFDPYYMSQQIENETPPIYNQNSLDTFLNLLVSAFVFKQLIVDLLPIALGLGTMAIMLPWAMRRFMEWSGVNKKKV